MDISEIKKRVELLQKAGLQKTVLISDVAKEMKVRITDLMEYILDNPKLFVTDEVWSWKKETYYEHMPWGKVKNTRSVHDKCKGLGITTVYISPEENWRTDEWLEKKIADNLNTIWISKWDNYGHIEGKYIGGEDFENNTYRTYLWRNTSAKIEKIKMTGVVKEGTFYLGGWGDCTSYKKDTVIDDEGIAKLREMGWTVIE